MKVLLIEDNPNFAFLVEAMLRSTDQENLSFTWADNLEKGIAELKQNPMSSCSTFRCPIAMAWQR